MKNEHEITCEFPKIGIRPTVDGRVNHTSDFVREQTMKMAKAAKKLFEENLHYYNGEPVSCVIADDCIDGVMMSNRTSEKFRRENVGVMLSVTSCWCYGAETMDLSVEIPQAIWGLNSTERPGAVYLACALAAHNQMGLPCFQIYGRDVIEKDDDEIGADVKEKLLRFGRAGLAVAQMKNKSYLAVGGVSMGIAGSNIDPNFFREYLGMKNEYADMCEVERRIQLGIYDHAEYERAIAWTKKNCTEGEDFNYPDSMHSRDKKDETWEYVVKMAMIIRDMMVGNKNLAPMGYTEEAKGHDAIAAGFQGQRHWSDYLPNGDFAESMLSASFDWNGIRHPYLLATENDSLNGISMLFGHLLSNAAQVFSDVRTYWSPEAFTRVTGETLTGHADKGFIHLINSGASAVDGSGRQQKDGTPAMKPFWEISEKEAQACLDATTWHPANREHFRGGGFSCRFITPGNMPVTMIRVNLVRGVGPVLQLCEGYTVEVSERAQRIIDERTDKTWPSTFFAPITTGKGAFVDAYSVMANWGANHAAFSYGHIGADLLTFASMLRIPVCMHNVPEEKIYRPTAWGQFGPSGEYASDFRACDIYGPLYR